MRRYLKKLQYKKTLFCLLALIVVLLGLCSGCSNYQSSHHTQPRRQTTVKPSPEARRIHHMSNTQKQGTPIVNHNKKSQKMKNDLWKTPKLLPKR